MQVRLSLSNKQLNILLGFDLGMRDNEACSFRSVNMRIYHGSDTPARPRPPLAAPPPLSFASPSSETIPRWDVIEGGRCRGSYLVRKVYWNWVLCDRELTIVILISIGLWLVILMLFDVSFLSYLCIDKVHEISDPPIL